MITSDNNFTVVSTDGGGNHGNSHGYFEFDQDNRPFTKTGRTVGMGAVVEFSGVMVGQGRESLTVALPDGYAMTGLRTQNDYGQWVRPRGRKITNG